MKPILESFRISRFIGTIYFFRLLTCHGDFIPERNCAYLYSNPNFLGDSFVLKDFDQSVNTKKDYRASKSGWWSTGSVQVKQDCILTVCDGTYFEGNCTKLTLGNYSDRSQTPPIFSANCTCTRECKCSDVDLPVPTGWWHHEYGRAYLNNGCNTCNSEYIQLTMDNIAIPQKFRAKVKSVILPPGYSITVTSGIVATPLGSTVQNFQGNFDSYKIECKNSLLCKNRVDYSNASSSKAFLLPDAEIDLVKYLYHSDSISTHPGLQAVRESYEHDRSPQNVYVVLFFDAESRSYERMARSIFRQTFDLPQCMGSDIQSIIRECHCYVNVDTLGISSAHIRLVSVPVIRTDETGEREFRQLASLDEYLSTRADLKDKIPNVVLVQLGIQNSTLEMTPSSHRIVKAISLMRTQLIDEMYSNVVFFFDNYISLNDSIQQNPEQLFKTIESTLDKTYGLPKPFHLLPALHIESNVEIVKFVKINGYYKTRGNEYFPRNFHETFKLLTEKGKDTLGHAVLDSWLQKARWLPDGNYSSANMRSENHKTVEEYKQLSESHIYPSIARQLVNVLKVCKRQKKLKDTALEQKFKALETQLSALPTQQHLNDIPKMVRDLEQKVIVLQKSKEELDDVMSQVKDDLIEMFS